jgi:hypothetical protein
VRPMCSSTHQSALCIGLLGLVLVAAIGLFTSTAAAAPCTPLDFGAQPTAGSTDVTGQGGCYSFAADAGDRVWIQVTQTSSAGNLTFSVTRPDGSTVCTDEQSCAIDTTGTHTIAVRDLDAFGGRFSVAIQRLNRPTGCASMLVGTPTPSTGGEVQCYRFGATAAERIQFTLAFGFTRTAPFPNRSLYSPDGTPLCATSGLTECTIQQSGTHTLMVEAPTGVTLALQRLDTPVGCTALPGSGAASQPPTRGGGYSSVQMDCYSYGPVSVGDRIRVRMVNLTTTSVRLTAYQPGQPQCGVVNGGSLSELTCVATSSGPLNIFTSGAGRYDLSATTLNHPTGCSELPVGGSPRTVVLSGTATTCWRFTGAAGAHMRLRTVTSTSSLSVKQEVIGPDGTPLCATTSQEIGCTLTSSGMHTIIYGPTTGSPATGEYYISLQRLDDPAGCTQLSYGALPTAGDLAAGEMDCFRFTAAAGDRVAFWSVGGTGQVAVPLVTEVLGPDGSSLCTATSSHGVCSLTESGDYTVIVHDSVGRTPGPYVTSVQRLNSPVGCVSKLAHGGAPIAGAFTIRGRFHCYTVDVQAGDQLRIHAVRTAGTLTPRLELLTPGGATICPATTTSDLTCEIGDSGTYTVLVRDSLGTHTGSYRIAVRRLNAATSCTSLPTAVPPVSASLVDSGEMDCFIVPAFTGDHIRLRAVETSGTLAARVEIFRQNGTPLCASATTTDVTCAVDTTGNLRVIVTDAAGAGTGGYVIAARRLNAPAGCTTVAVGAPSTADTIGATAEMDCFRFTVTAGQTITVHVAETSGTLVATQEVLRLDGTTLCAPTTATDLICTVGAAGTYGVIVAGSGGTGTGGYTFRAM